MKRLSLITLLTGTILACTLSTPTTTQWPAAVTSSENPPATLGATDGPEMVSVWIYFTIAADSNMTPVPIARTVPASNELATLIHSTLAELMRGPTDAEKAVGLISWFSPATENSVIGISLSNGDLEVDFSGLNTLIPNASTSAGSQMLLSQLNGTLFQFAPVNTVQYSLDGNCSAFWEWLQSGCHPVTRAEWAAG